MLDQRINSAVQCTLKCSCEPMDFPLSVRPSKEMGDRARQRKKYLTSTGIEPTTSGFDRHVWLILCALRA